MHQRFGNGDVIFRHLVDRHQVLGYDRLAARQHTVECASPFFAA